MAAIGKYNRLRVVKQKDFGLYLDGENLGEILLPKRYVPEDCRIGAELDVFIYLDSEDCLIATTEHPLAQVGMVAYLRVASVGPVGAFMNWGLPKDLLVPFGEQKRPMEEDRSYLVYVYLDNSNRIAGSTKLDRHLSKEAPSYSEKQQVELIIAERTDLGVKAIINNSHWGVVHNADIFQAVRFGQKVTGYIKQIRADGKIDLFLQKPGYSQIDELGQKILDRLKQEGGFLAVSDKSDPEKITQMFSASKKRFKMAIGGLYKQKLIRIEKDGIYLV